MNAQQPTLQPHQQRVIDELAELNERIEKLSVFIGGDIYNALEETDRYLLRVQRSAMYNYAEILHMRVKRFSPPPQSQ
ncbi:crAss001_48 related protein [Xenorhabdus entomophaga]|uniref:crAss001_48 related protein n=1 Tax=Xenorhabdus entomophaga TaxID=3136257 RepID=UPI0030F4B04E